MPPKAPDSHAVDAPPSVSPGIAKRRILLAGKLLLAAGLFWLLFRFGLLEVGPLLTLLDSWGVVLLVAALAFMHWPVAALRWHMLLHVQGLDPSFRDTFRVAYSAAFVGLYLPGGIGFDMARIGLGLSLSRSKLSLLALSVVADRILGIMGLMVLGLAASAAYAVYLSPGSTGVAGSMIGAVASLFGAVLAVTMAVALAAPRLARIAEGRMWDKGQFMQRLLAQGIFAARLYLTRPGTLAIGVGLSIVLHSLTLVCLVVVAAGIGLGDVSVWKYALAGTMSLVVNSLPVTPGGVGVGEAAFSQFMLWLEPQSGALPYATAFLACRVITAVTLIPALAGMPTSFRRANT